MTRSQVAGQDQASAYWGDERPRGPIQFIMESPRVAFETIQVADKAAADQGFTDLEGYHYDFDKGDTLKLVHYQW